jgi:hypothetical protein
MPKWEQEQPCTHAHNVISMPNSYTVKFQVLTVANVKLAAFPVFFLDMASCSLMEVDRRFRGTNCFHHPGDDKIWPIYLSGYDHYSRDTVQPWACIVNVRFQVLTHPWWWRQYAPLKRRSTIILHDSTTQKTALNIVLSMFALKQQRLLNLNILKNTNTLTLKCLLT